LRDLIIITRFLDCLFLNEAFHSLRRSPFIVTVTATVTKPSLPANISYYPLTDLCYEIDIAYKIKASFYKQSSNNAKY